MICLLSNVPLFLVDWVDLINAHDSFLELTEKPVAPLGRPNGLVEEGIILLEFKFLIGFETHHGGVVLAQVEGQVGLVVEGLALVKFNGNTGVVQDCQRKWLLWVIEAVWRRDFSVIRWSDGTLRRRHYRLRWNINTIWRGNDSFIRIFETR